MNLLLCTSLTVVLAALLFTNVHSKSFSKREISDSGVDPTKFEVNIADVDREKRGYDHHHDFQVPEVDYKAQGVEHKYVLKNALLGFVFHKINSFIDKKTEWIDHLDKSNIPKNKAAGIYPPKDEKTTLAGAISGIIGSKLEAAGPVISFVTHKLTSGSSLFNKGHGGDSGGLHGGSSAGKGFDVGGQLGGLLGAFAGGSSTRHNGDSYGTY
ncbi:uncharacterized protein LOC108744851 [Agrilus planipennis]|uniref:Uncharacterized protein LOC108744851 n=1 Tax=Agrilus planipennis TaxID=224129 RepID=A0A1W4XJL2_AGRPL|nr:uncharacterized protein LOC108744851 [Agrilus planipennis]XP_018336307.1 uncharacterized protein LOC108744851 [Agrilus planipennis]